MNAQEILQKIIVLLDKGEVRVNVFPEKDNLMTTMPLLSNALWLGNGIELDILSRKQLKLFILH